jgi:hypothetical protein
VGVEAVAAYQGTRIYRLEYSGVPGFPKCGNDRDRKVPTPRKRRNSASSLKQAPACSLRGCSTSCCRAKRKL